MEQSNRAEWIPVEMLQAAEAHEHDAVVLLKEWASSLALTQRPLVLAPRRLALLLRGTSPRVWSRDRMSQRLASELLKTAALIEKEPWHHDRAATWLRRWVRNNQEGVEPSAVEPALNLFAFALDWSHDRLAGETVRADPLGWHRYAPFEVLVRQVQAHHDENPRLSGPAAKKRQRREGVADLPPDDSGMRPVRGGRARAARGGGRGVHARGRVAAAPDSAPVPPDHQDDHALGRGGRGRGRRGRRAG